MEWSDEVITRLRALWEEGLSTAEIGRKLGASKNAVVGKAHRLGLASRPSPIRREGSGKARRPAARRVTGPTLPPLSVVAVPEAAATTIRPEVVESSAPAMVRVAPVEPSVPVVRVVAPRTGRVSACCWPLGDPGTPTFRFCDAESAPGKPYCADHAQLAYVKVRDRREEAA